MKTIKELAEDLDTYWDLSDEEYLGRLTAFAEAYHKAMLEASPPVEVEPVGVVVGWSDENGDIPVKWYDIPAVDAKLYTSPPDTEALKAKLKRAVEALKYVSKELNMYGYQDTSRDSINLVLREALKDIGEIK